MVERLGYWLGLVDYSHFMAHTHHHPTFLLDRSFELAASILEYTALRPEVHILHPRHQINLACCYECFQQLAENILNSFNQRMHLPAPMEHIPLRPHNFELAPQQDYLPIFAQELVLVRCKPCFLPL